MKCNPVCSRSMKFHSLWLWTIRERQYWWLSEEHCHSGWDSSITPFHLSIYCSLSLTHLFMYISVQDLLTDLSADCENLPVEGVSGTCYAHKVGGIITLHLHFSQLAVALIQNDLQYWVHAFFILSSPILVPHGNTNPQPWRWKCHALPTEPQEATMKHSVWPLFSPLQ